MIKILHLQPELNKTCGITKSILLLCQHSPAEFQHIVFTLGGDNINQFEENGIQVHVLKADRNSFVHSLKIIINLVRLCRNETIDIFHSHHRYFDLTAYFVSKFSKIKRITSVHSKVEGKKFFSYKSPYLIAVGESIKAHLINYYRINKNRISVINNFTVIPSETVTDALGRQNSLPKDKKIILFAGRFSKEKGIDILLRAVEKLKTKGENFFLVLVGDGEESDFVYDFISNKFLNAAVVFTQDDISIYYKNADLVVLPSRVDPFPLVMLEAGAFAKPFVGSNVDGIAEFIENEKDGMLVQPENVDELAGAIESLIKNSQHASFLGTNLFEKVRQKYLPGNIIPRFIELYNKVVSDSGRLNILGINIYNISYDDLVLFVSNSISSGNKISIAYCTASTLNIAYTNDSLKNVLQLFDYVHPDGLGVYLASKFLYGTNGLKKRITGSDFYPILIDEGIKNAWRFYFLGDEDETLQKIKSVYPMLQTAGMHNGFNFDDNEVICDINKSKTDILVVGLGSPFQEEWITKYKNEIETKVIIAVGEGIKVFAGTKKRGFKFVRIIGLEWAVRLLNDPKKFWKRYLIGIPLFLCRVIKFKFRKRIEE